MTNSPYFRFRPTAVVLHSVSAGQKEAETAVQGLCALMGDSRPHSLVLCHAHGAQNLEFRLAVSERLCSASGGGKREPEKRRIFRKLFIDR
jgi:hypothetical protein